MKNALLNIRKTIDGTQPIDTRGAVMAIDALVAQLNHDGPAEPVGLADRDNVRDLFRELEQEGAITRAPVGRDPAADALAPKHPFPQVVGTARDNAGHQPGRTNA